MIPQICARVMGPAAVTAHEAGCSLVRVLIRCIFVRVVTELKTCHIYEAVLWTIKAVICNLSGVSNFLP
jgi:hypothetical protein